MQMFRSGDSGAARHKYRGKLQIPATLLRGRRIRSARNDAGHAAIEIGVKEFMCVGANPPFDHPHEFLDMGADSEKVCPYCSTLYKYNPALHGDETVPAGCSWAYQAA